MFTSNNLSIIDETGRSDVMAAAIPATNKWLLTKQASVALSGLWDDRHGAEQSIEKQEARGAKREAEHWTLLLTWASRGLEKAQRAETVPWWKVVDTPLRSLQDSVNRRWMRVKKRRVGASGTARWEQLHGMSWVQWASCPLFFHLWVLCQIQSTWLSSLGNQLTAPPPSPPSPHRFYN